MAGRYSVPLCRELASVFAHQCPRGGFRGLGESPSHPYWNVSLGQGARIAIDADPLPHLPAVYYDTEWHGATQFSIEGDSRLRRAAAIAKQQRVGASGAAPTSGSNLSAQCSQQVGAEGQPMRGSSCEAAALVGGARSADHSRKRAQHRGSPPTSRQTNDAGLVHENGGGLPSERQPFPCRLGSAARHRARLGAGPPLPHGRGAGSRTSDLLRSAMVLLPPQRVSSTLNGGEARPRT